MLKVITSILSVPGPEARRSISQITAIYIDSLDSDCTIVVLKAKCHFNPCAAELFVSIFYSFKKIFVF